ncbi:NUDIX hydrolase [Microbacterium sp. ZW T5_56]|uniref:NUDIX hydrolase n=1 Tax=Microbacterium sp. ZW T5_56 TaxID=3378081 RepID=UPI003853FFEC
MGSESNDAERVIRRIDGAPWLPHGRAEVVLSEVIPRPVGLVRVLVRRGGEVYCTPREDGRQDIPTRQVPVNDPHGSATVARLATELGIAPESLRPLGFVRNIVSPPALDYPWPMPLAHFAVWTSAEQPTGPGLWVAESELRDRHWYPLLGPAQPPQGWRVRAT